MEDFVNSMNNLSTYSTKSGIPLEQLQSHISNLYERINILKKEMKSVIIKRNNLLDSYEMTDMKLDEYERNKPLVSKIESQNNEIERLTRVISDSDSLVVSYNTIMI